MSISISNNAIKRLALKASVGSLSSRVNDEIRTEIYSISKEICHRAETMCEMRKQKTISLSDVEGAISSIYYLHDMKLGENTGKNPRNIKVCPNIVDETFGMKNHDKITERRVEKSKKLFNCFNISKSVFKKLMDEYTKDDKRKSNDALIVFQEAVENHIINIFNHAQQMNENKIMKSKIVITAINMIKQQHGKIEETHKEKFDIYIRQLLKKIHPDISISSNTLFQINTILNLVANKLATESLRLCRMDKKSTVSVRHVQQAIRISIPKELAKHSLIELNKAITKASSQTPMTTNRNHAGIQFPPSRAGNFMSDHSDKTGIDSKIALAATLQYLCEEMVELSGNVAMNHHKSIINNRHLFLTINEDSELSKLINIVLGYKIPLTGVFS